MQTLKVGKHEVQITHEDKILFPESPLRQGLSGHAKITKGELINYYLKISPVMIKHMKNRPVMMHRFVEGIGQEGFYQKNTPDYYPEWIERAEIKKIEEGEIEQVLCNNPETLIYIANQ